MNDNLAGLSEEWRDDAENAEDHPYGRVIARTLRGCADELDKMLGKPFGATVILNGQAMRVDVRVVGGALWYAPAGHPEDDELGWKVVRIDTGPRPPTPGEVLDYLNTRHRPVVLNDPAPDTSWVQHEPEPKRWWHRLRKPPVST